MNLLAWLLSLTLLTIALKESVDFFSATLCRQKAWLISTELQTRSLLDSPKAVETSFNPKCQLQVTRRASVSWQRVGSQEKHLFYLPLKGKL
jgi:hypothetical protein